MDVSALRKSLVLKSVVSKLTPLFKVCRVRPDLLRRNRLMRDYMAICGLAGRIILSRREFRQSVNKIFRDIFCKRLIIANIKISYLP